MTIHVKVLQHHIDEGVRKSPYQCAVAKALQEQFPDAGYWSVGIGMFIGSDYYEPPEEVNHFISRFDSNWDVHPFEFDLSDPLPPEL
jgi:hypothetical protein